jgi:hypothetical protein
MTIHCEELTLHTDRTIEISRDSETNCIVINLSGKFAPPDIIATHQIGPIKVNKYENN